MNCEQSLHYLDPLVDNELSIDLTSEVMRHLDSCLQCQNQWTEITRLHATISGALNRIEIPDGLVPRIQERVGRSHGNRRVAFEWRKLRILSAVAAFVLVAIVAFFLISVPKPKDSLVPNDLVADHHTATAAAPVKTPQDELKKLQKTLALGPVNLPGWKLVKVEACQIDKLPAIHLCYVNDKKQMLSCYQLKHGLFDATGLKKHSMNGRIYCCGQLKDVSIVYCPSDKHDKILVSAMPERELMSIAVKS